MEYEPRANTFVGMVTVALPLTSVRVPITVVPRFSVTVPPGVIPPGDVTVIVNVTGVPRVTGFCDEVSPVIVDAVVITCASADDELGWNVCPMYSARIWRVPTPRIGTVRRAIPPTVFLVPSQAPPSRNRTGSPSGGGAPADDTT